MSIDVLDIENSFAYALGIEPGTRGRANDADTIRMGTAKDLAKAITKACDRLERKAGDYIEGDSVFNVAKINVGQLRDMAAEVDRLADKITGPAKLCLWSAAAIALEQISYVIDERRR